MKKPGKPMKTALKAVEDMLPPDPEGKNEERAAWALHAVKAFQDATGRGDETAIGDLLCNLMHLCDRMRDRYQRGGPALSQAGMHYEAETMNGEEDDAEI